ncbi:site-specific tyrosine recombinase XerD [archaeon]|nr:site-specific tyrosine recombinase XerD [archaeon]
MQKWGFYDKEGERLRRLLLQLPELSEGNRNVVQDFLNELEALGSAKVTMRQYLEGLLFADKIIDFKTATKRDVMKVVGKIERSGNAPQTKMMRKAKLKKFFKWLRSYDDGYLPEVSWFRTTLSNNKKVLPEDLLTPEEVEKLISVAKDIRTKALIATLYDTGCRASELLTMRVKDVTL